MEFAFRMQINTKVSKNWHYRFWWKQQIRRLVIFLQYIKEKVFCFLMTAFVFYCDVKHLDILWRSSHVCCYLFLIYPKMGAVFYTMVFPNSFNECLINSGKVVPCLMQYSRKYGKWPEIQVLIQCSYCHSSIWKFCYSSYHTPKLKNIVILAITFSPLISKFYQLATWNFFRLVIQLKFFWR